MKNVEVPKWLKGLRLAPEFRPTDTEFADPIAYISKIEKEASAFGICKVIPPLPRPSKKYVVHNLNKSLSKCPDLGCDVNVARTDNGGKVTNGSGEVRAVFTTRHQELGNGGKRVKEAAVGGSGVCAQKQVWQSGEIYTLEQFEAKSKSFARSQLGSVKDVSPSVIEAMFWKAAIEKPIYVEYANDVPGSGFAEPEGSFRYFRRRRRRKRGTFDRNSGGSSVSTVNGASVDAGSCYKSSNNICTEGSRESDSLPSSSSDQSTLPNRRKSSNAGVDTEGTAGWKLSNSPWNLQVIARSPGSLTRFMPDDIPGVTSPMVYVGMLFSWFAWHVEDHELHSLNFLHMGSAKTWYAVPGDYALQFEEVIRHHAYGENTDHLASLTRLGEKTTLLSPEVVVASGIPCCRVVQNPGEFVVTFPRAYHVGFSHGFNCGEAANFGTPQWLAVAKEAAVRRAAMNFLPMLSHQQLLYLLTMSFVSRVPRSLLPGVRSSRLRDRQKEERERLVKKAFIEDVLMENKLLTNLLHRSSAYRVVEWDLESLPSSSKGPELLNSTNTIATASIEDDDSKNGSNQHLSSQMSLYMDAIDDFYVDDDGLLCDFQVDSGALPCVACGILGFPFMAILQPSEKASTDLLEDYDATRNLGALRKINSTSTSELNNLVDGYVPGKLNSVSRNILHDPGLPFPQSLQTSVQAMDDRLSALDDTCVKLNPASTAPMLQRGWNNSTGFLRPRIFCLEHAAQTERLLHSRGGANVLAICHADFRKIKAHVLAVAEEIGTPFCYEEIPLVDASVEDLNLIDLATDSEQQHESSEHWTSNLCINLLHCMKLRKQFPSSNVQHALTLSGLFSVSSQASNSSSLFWELRKSRSKRNSKHSAQTKFSTSSQMEKHEGSMSMTDSFVAGEQRQILQIDKNEVKKANSHRQISGEVKQIIQYSRRRYKSKPFVSIGVDPGRNLLTSRNVLAAGTACADMKTATMPESTSRSIADSGNSFPIPNFETTSGEAMLNEHQVLLLTENDTENPLLSVDAELHEATISAVDNIEMETRNVEVKELFEQDTGPNLISHATQPLEEDKVVEEHSEKSLPGTSRDPDGTADRSSEYGNTTSEFPSETKLSFGNSPYPLEADHLGTPRDKSADASKSAMSSVDDPSAGRSDEQMGNTGELCLSLHSKLVDSPPLNNRLEQEGKTAHGDCRKVALPSNTLLIEESGPSVVIGLEVPHEVNVAECSHHEDGNNFIGGRMETDDTDSIIHSRSSAKGGRKRKWELDLQAYDQYTSNGFIKSPCEGLRPRTRSDTTFEVTCKKPVMVQKARKRARHLIPQSDATKNRSHKCDIEGCTMSFRSKSDLCSHKRNRCTNEECGKKFSSHKNLILHQRVHNEDRPLKCPWKGCAMSFKWAWARTEHMRVHTGERPYKCKVDGCGLTFRFVSDYSRHRRKTGHYID